MPTGLPPGVLPGRPVRAERPLPPGPRAGRERGLAQEPEHCLLEVVDFRDDPGTHLGQGRPVATDHGTARKDRDCRAQDDN